MKLRKLFSDRLIQRFFYKYYSRNVLYELQLRARSEAADYVQQNMADARIFMGHQQIIEFAVRNAPSQGLFLEFGVATGNTVREIAAHVPAGVTVYGFDSFSGLPGDWTGHLEIAGAFRQKGVPRGARQRQAGAQPVQRQSPGIYGGASRTGQLRAY
jgi:hypothetical protein